jgi:hypothetical protein
MAAANAADKAMTLALLNGRPRVLALDAWDAEYRTPLLGSPFKRAPWPDNQGAVPSASKRRMSKAVLKDGRDEAFAKARALGPRMMVVDGVAYHETRLPCWKIGPSRPEALITDLGTPVHHVLVDPRYDFAEIARVLGREANAKSNAIRILRPELVDGCVEVDAAGSVAMAFVANQKAYVGEIERSLFALCLRMVDAAERASVADDPSSALAAFHGCIEELASYRPSDESWSKCPGMVDRAKTYLAAHAAFPPIRNLAETDDLDAIAGLRP